MKTDTMTDESQDSFSMYSSSISLKSNSPTPSPAKGLASTKVGIPLKTSQTNLQSEANIDPPKSPGRVRLGALSPFQDSKRAQLRTLSSNSTQNLSHSNTSLQNPAIQD